MADEDIGATSRGVVWLIAAAAVAAAAVIGFVVLNQDSETDPAAPAATSSDQSADTRQETAAPSEEDESDAPAETTQTPVDPTGPFVRAVLDENHFVLSGAVWSAELATALLEAARVTYAPFVSSKLVVDQQLEPVEWLAQSPRLITLLPTITDGTLVIADGEISVAGRAPSQAHVGQLEAVLSQVSGLTVHVDEMEITNLDEPQYALAASGGQVTLSGVIPSEEVRENLLDGAVASYGAGNVIDELTVDDGVHSTLVMYKGLALFQVLSTFSDYELQLDGTSYSGFLSGGFGFDFGSAEISPAYAQFLDFGVGSLIRNPTVTFVLEGHTDSIGSAEFNLELSQSRADAVRDFYIAEGFDPDRITPSARARASRSLRTTRRKVEREIVESTSSPARYPDSWSNLRLGDRGEGVVDEGLVELHPVDLAGVSGDFLEKLFSGFCCRGRLTVG